jgi:hypothetical protein
VALKEAGYTGVTKKDVSLNMPVSGGVTSGLQLIVIAGLSRMMFTQAQISRDLVHGAWSHGQAMQGLEKTKGLSAGLHAQARCTKHHM